MSVLALWLPFWALLFASTSVPAVALAHAAALLLDTQTPSQLPQVLEGIGKLVPRDAHALLAAIDLSRHDGARFCVVAGITGVSSNLV